MSFSQSGPNIIQNGVDTALLANIDAFNNVSVFEAMIRKIDNSNMLRLDGDFSDETGSFALMLVGDSKIGITNGVAGKFRVGRRDVVDGKPVYSKGGLLIIKNDGSDAAGYLSYAFNINTGISTSGEISLYDTDFIHYTSTANTRSHCFISNLCGSSLRVVNQNAGADNYLNLRFQDNARVDDNVIQNVKQFEFHGNPVSFKRNKFIDTYGFIAWSNGTRINLNNIDFIGQLSSAGITNNGGLFYIDTYRNGSDIQEAEINNLPADNFANLGIFTNTNPELHGFQWGKSQTETMKDPAGNTVDDLVYYRDTFGTEFTPTVVNGLYSETIRLKRATNTGTGVPTYSNYYPIVKGIIGYNTNIEANTYNSYDEFPSLGVASDSTRLRTADLLITELDALVTAAYTSTDNAYMGYDSAKLRLANNYLGEGVTDASRGADVFKAGSHNLTIDANAATAYAFDGSTFTFKTTNYVGGIESTGTITQIGAAQTINYSVTGTLTLPTAGDWTLDGVSVDTLENTSGSNINLFLTNGSPAPVLLETNGTITIINDMNIDITGIPTGAAIYITRADSSVKLYKASALATESITAPNNLTGTPWQYVVKLAGYEPQTGTFTIIGGASITIPVSLRQIKTAQGLNMYQGTTSAFVTVSYNGLTQANIAIGDGSAPLQAVFDMSEDSLQTQDGMEWTRSGLSNNAMFNSSGGDYLFISANWRIIRRLAGDVNATVEAFVLSTDGTPVDGVNGSVAFLTSDTPQAVADAVWNAVKTNYNITNSMGELLKYSDNIIKSVFFDGDAVTNGDGSQGAPFSVFNDAVDLAESMNVNNIVIYSDVTFTRDVKNFKITGVGRPLVDLNGHDFKNSEFTLVRLTGDYTSPIVAHEVAMIDGSYMNGLFQSCTYTGVSTCVVGSEVIIKDSASSVAGVDRPTIAMSAGTKLSVRGWEGGLLLTNVATATDEVTIDVNVGGVTLDPTCTDGTIVVRNNGKVVDNSNGSDVVNEAFIGDIYTRLGLNKDNAFTDNENQFTSQNGDIVIDITGDGITTTTQTRT